MSEPPHRTHESKHMRAKAFARRQKRMNKREGKDMKGPNVCQVATTGKPSEKGKCCEPDLVENKAHKPSW